MAENTKSKITKILLGIFCNFQFCISRHLPDVFIVKVYDLKLSCPGPILVSTAWTTPQNS